MSSGFLDDRRKSMEESFFAKQDADLRAKLQANMEHKERRKALATASGITQEGVLDELMRLKIGPEEVAALSLIPLIEVAWADGSIDKQEHAALMNAAAESGIEPGSPSSLLLSGWLTKRPQPELMNAWKDYIAALRTEMKESSLIELRKWVIRRAQTVAESAGGFLGLGSKINSAEQDVLLELEKAFG